MKKWGIFTRSAARRRARCRSSAAAISARFPSWSPPRPATRFHERAQGRTGANRIAPPCYTQGIQPKVKGAEEKISAGLTRLHDEDPSFETEFNPETKQHTISGAGDIHLDVLCSKLKDKFGVEVVLTPPIVPYREKDPQDRHGRGQA